MTRRVIPGCLIASLASLGLLACGAAQPTEPAPLPEACLALDADEAPQPPAASEAPATYIVNGTVMTANGDIFAPGWVAYAGERIVGVGEGEPELPEGAQTIDARGRYVTPGLIDTHSHLGVYATPHVAAHSDGNEATHNHTGQVRSLDGSWPQDPGFERALAGGVTSLQILPGSANLVGGYGYTMWNRPGALHLGDNAIPGAPYTVKLACGENPKRVYGERGGPQTRMGSNATMRQHWIDAANYLEQQEEYEESLRAWCDEGAPEADEPSEPTRNLRYEAMARILAGEALPQIHCYRADEMLTQIETSDEFGFEIRGFHHATSAYKIRHELAERGISVSTWTDWWGFKMEAYDSIVENAALVHLAGGYAVIHSDSAYGIQRLNQETGKAWYAALHAGLEISEDDALRWITYNAAYTMGIEDLTGTLEPGKYADITIWSGHPFSIYTRADQVIITGETEWVRADAGEPFSDFELGLWPHRLLEHTYPVPSEPRVDRVGGTSWTLPSGAPALSDADGFGALGEALASGGEVCLTNAQVHPVASDAYLGTLCMRDGVVTRVGEDAQAPSGAQTLDVGGQVVTPGLVDIQTQLGLVEVGAVEGSRHGDEGGEDEVRAAFRTLDAFDPTSSLLGVTTLGGVTSVVAAPSGGLISGQGFWFDLLAGPPNTRWPGDMATGAWAMTMHLGGGAGRATGGASRASAILRYREIFRDAALYYANRRAHDRAQLRDLSVSALDLDALEPVLSGEAPVMVHARHPVDIRAALRLAEEFGLRIAIVNGDDAWAVAEELADANVPVVLDPMRNLPANFDALGAREDAAARLVEAGVPLAITANSAHNVRLLRFFAGNAVRAGLAWDDALRAVTLTPAQLLGMTEHGHLSAGAVANVAVWSGDPFETSTRVEALFVRGEPVELTSRQTALFERYRDR